MPLKILFIEPFFGGSHRDFAEGLQENTRHKIVLQTMPARFWKWRMRGAALHFMQTVKNPEQFDLVFTSDMLAVADLKALWGALCPPVVVYFHENQLSYPVPKGEAIDFQFGFTNITTALAADGILFNSQFHYDSFFGALPGFIRMMPEFNPLWCVEPLKQKSSVLYPGCRFEDAEGIRAGPSAATHTLDKSPLIIWNHRWEFDKEPETFFEALDRVEKSGIDFELALLGENFQKVPKAFIQAKQRFGSRIVRYGFEPSKERYLKWLESADVVVSTAQQENFGISIVEAIRFGCFPLLPNRLSYPEILPVQFHLQCIYSDIEELVDKLARLLTSRSIPDKSKLQEAMNVYAWKNMIGKYDGYFEQIYERHKNK
jgi:glycosyltransferase involved in cell wall biosynthesis